MPLVELEIVSSSPGRQLPSRNDVQALADDLGAVLNSERGGTWVRVRTLPRDQYAENGGRVPAAVRPVFVSITQRERPGSDALESQAEVIAESVAAVLDRESDHVHVIYEPAGAGRIAFGGTRWV